MNREIEALDFSFVLADIPGLIEGAHQGRGLGDQFLGHVERCAVLLHLIDVNNDDVCGAYDVIRGELLSYGNGLGAKPEVIALNKADTLPPDLVDEKIMSLKSHTGQDVHLISGVTGQGVRPVLFALKSQIASARAPAPEKDRYAQAVHGDSSP